MGYFESASGRRGPDSFSLMSDKGCDWTSGLREPCFECCRGHRHDVLAAPQEKFSDYVYEPIYIELFFKPVVIPTLYWADF